MKFSGVVGFWMKDVETSPGIYQSEIVERSYCGDIRQSQNVRRWQEADQQNDRLRVSNSVTILSDLFARHNYTSIKYVIYEGVKLKVTTVTLDYPRITLEIGGEYNGENASDSP